MVRKTKNETTWWDILAIIVVCILVGIVGARAQSYKQKDISQSDFVIYLDTMPSHIPIGSQIPDSTIVYRIGDYMQSPFDYPYLPIKSAEYHIGTSWISERDKSAIIGYLVELIADLMEPGEIITIKKVKE